MDGLHHHLPKAGSGVCVVIGQINLLRLVVAAPDSSSVILGKAAEPAVTVRGGGAGLAGNILSGEYSGSTSTVVGCVIQAVVHIVDGLLAENLPAFLLVVQHDLTVTVIDLGIGPGSAVYAIVCKGGIGRRHFPHCRAHRQSAQGQGRNGNVGHIHAAGGHVTVHQIILAEIILGKAEAVVRADLVQSIGSNGVDGGRNALEDGFGIAIDPTVVFGPSAAVIGQGHIPNHRSRAVAPLFKGGRIDGQRLLGGAGLELGLGGLVIGEEVVLLPHAAGQRHNIAGGIVNDHNAGLKLLGASGGGDVVQVGVDGIHLVLNVQVQGGVDMVAALLDFFQIVVPGGLIHVVPHEAVLQGKIGGHIQNHRIHKPAIDVLGGIQADGSLGAAAGAEIQISLVGVGTDCAAIAAVVTHGPSVLVGNAVLEHKRLVIGLDIFLVGEIALVQHFVQNAFLPVAVAPSAVPHFPLVHIDAGGIGVKQGGVIGDADQAGAFGNGQALQLLAKVGRGGGFDTVAALAQVNSVQVLLHDDILVILLFQKLGPENLHDLTLNRDALFVGGVFHQLLGDGGAAELRVAAEEHIGAGLHRGDPVHALVLIKPFILDGHRGINQRFGNLVPGGGLTVRGGINLLKQLDVAIIVHIMDIGCFFNVIVLIGPVLCFLQNIILKILGKCAHKYHTADEADEQHRGRSAQGDFCRRKQGRPQGVNQFNRPVGIPLLANLLSAPVVLILICH